MIVYVQWKIQIFSKSHKVYIIGEGVTNYKAYKVLYCPIKY